MEDDEECRQKRRNNPDHHDGVAGQDQVADEKRRDVEYPRHRQDLAAPARARDPAQHVADGDAHHGEADVGAGLDRLDQAALNRNAEDEQERYGHERGRQEGETQQHHEKIGDEGAGHHHVAMAEIDDSGGAVHYGHRQRHECVDRALGNAAKNELRKQQRPDSRSGCGNAPPTRPGLAVVGQLVTVTQRVACPRTSKRSACRSQSPQPQPP